VCVSFLHWLVLDLISTISSLISSRSVKSTAFMLLGPPTSSLINQKKWEVSKFFKVVRFWYCCYQSRQTIFLTVGPLICLEKKNYCRSGGWATLAHYILNFVSLIVVRKGYFRNLSLSGCKRENRHNESSIDYQHTTWIFFLSISTNLCRVKTSLEMLQHPNSSLCYCL
jgi:hypothetical protein